MYQEQAKIKTEIDIIEDNTLEVLFPSENNDTIKEEFYYPHKYNHLIKNNKELIIPLARYDEMLELSEKKIKSENIDNPKHRDIAVKPTKTSTLNDSKIKEVCRGHDDMKTEIDIIEDNTLENLFPNKFNGTIKEEFYNIYNETPELNITKPKKKGSSTFIESFSKNMKINYTENKINKCDNRKNSFTQRANLIPKLTINSGENLFVCGVCEESFTWIYHFTRHMKSHSGEKPNEYKVSKDLFTQNGYLKKHMKIHSGEKPYECVVCKKMFTLNTSLKRHMNIHTRQKSYVCEICEVLFNRNESLKRHMKVHTGQKSYECVVCKKSYKYQGSLKSHMQVHSRE